ncbi:hypothetical protein [Thermodesulforhabdus norvegica]|uniref:Uncharacterized protein n=1 Tax=Thermodesulforhabdus norvegica TaxID=39841 RepID=A0A1I4SUX4_9BACT|nr:hypothetical protein [Thermodesulforhabdus norvegica]SFM68231.1 hypothetical protein SAMN05660836_01177 [Thermodesulforhabdus norvegica]
MGRIRAWLLRCLGALGDFLRALFARGIASELERLLPIALEAVRVMGDQNLSGEEKRVRAAQLIRERTMQAQWMVAADLINLAIEMSVQKWKAEQN